MTILFALSLQDAAGAVFGLSILLWAVWKAYRDFIKSERESRRHRAEASVEEMHRQHWERLRNRPTDG